jgi:GTPase SAR1 family protein
MVFTKKVIILGDGGVGKTVTVNRLETGEFDPRYVASHKITSHIIRDTYKVNIFPGQYKYSFDKLICNNEDTKYDRVVIMCDINNTLSFKNAFDWLDLASDISHETTEIVLCINKYDGSCKSPITPDLINGNGEDHKFLNTISGNMLDDMFEAFDFVYYVSAKTNLNINKILGNNDTDEIMAAVAPPEVMITDADRERIFGK